MFLVTREDVGFESWPIGVILGTLKNSRYMALIFIVMKCLGHKQAYLITYDLQTKVVQTKSYSTPIVWTENQKSAPLIIGCCLPYVKVLWKQHRLRRNTVIVSD